MPQQNFLRNRFDKDHFVLDFFDNEFRSIEISVFSDSDSDSGSRLFLSDDGEMSPQEKLLKVTLKQPERPISSCMVLHFNDSFLYTLNKLYRKYAPFRICLYLDGKKQDTNLLVSSRIRYPGDNYRFDINQAVGVLIFYDTYFRNKAENLEHLAGGSGTFPLEAEQFDSKPSSDEKGEIVHGRTDAVHQNLLFQSGTKVFGIYTVTGFLDNVVSDEVQMFSAVDSAGKELLVKCYMRENIVKNEILAKLKNISNPHIIRLIDYGSFCGRTVTVLYICHGKTLREVINSGRRFTEQFIRERFLGQIAGGLNALHTLDIVHRNVKPDSIIYDEDTDNFVLTDCGICSDAGEQTSFIYAAPETRDNVYLNDSDYYSLGIVIYEMVVGCNPFFYLKGSDAPAEDEARNNTINLIFPNDFPESVKHLVLGLTFELKQKNDQCSQDRRWTYDDVIAWIGWDSTIPGKSIRDFLKSYNFCGHDYLTVSSLYESFLANWELGQKEISSGRLYEFINSYGRAKYKDPIAKIQKILDSDRAQEFKDYAYFYFLYEYSTGISSLYWRQFCFYSVEDFGNALINVCHKFLMNAENSDNNDAELLKGAYLVIKKKLLYLFLKKCDFSDDERQRYLDKLSHISGIPVTCEKNYFQFLQIGYILADRTDFSFDGLSCVDQEIFLAQGVKIEEYQPICLSSQKIEVYEDRIINSDPPKFRFRMMMHIEGLIPDDVKEFWYTVRSDKSSKKWPELSEFSIIDDVKRVSASACKSNNNMIEYRAITPLINETALYVSFLTVYGTAHNFSIPCNLEIKRKFSGTVSWKLRVSFFYLIFFRKFRNAVLSMRFETNTPINVIPKLYLCVSKNNAVLDSHDCYDTANSLVLACFEPIYLSESVTSYIVEHTLDYHIFSKDTINKRFYLFQDRNFSQTFTIKWDKNFSGVV